MLSTLSFAAGIAGDLSMADPPNYGERVVLRLPPEIPADAPRAGPLPSLLSTASAAERQSRFTPIRFEAFDVSPLTRTPSARFLLTLAKENPVRLGKQPMARRKAV